jgi:hypothetical protein
MEVFLAEVRYEWRRKDIHSYWSMGVTFILGRRICGIVTDILICSFVVYGKKLEK